MDLENCFDIDDDGQDPYHAEATVAERVGHVVSALLLDGDAGRRYATVQALHDGPLRDVQALSLRQLRDQLGTTDAAAEAVGITRSAANQMVAKAGQPGARQDRGLRDTPAWAYGATLAVLRDIVRAGPDASAYDRFSDLWVKASLTLAVLPVLTATAHRWISKARSRSGTTADDLTTALGEAIIQIGDRATTGDPHLTLEEQSAFVLGYHHTQHARRPWRAEHIRWKND